MKGRKQSELEGNPTNHPCCFATQCGASRSCHLAARPATIARPSRARNVLDIVSVFAMVTAFLCSGITRAGALCLFSLSFLHGDCFYRPLQQQQHCARLLLLACYHGLSIALLMVGSLAAQEPDRRVNAILHAQQQMESLVCLLGARFDVCSFVLPAICSSVFLARETSLLDTW